MTKWCNEIYRAISGKSCRLRSWCWWISTSTFWGVVLHADFTCPEIVISLLQNLQLAQIILAKNNILNIPAGGIVIIGCGCVRATWCCLFTATSWLSVEYRYRNYIRQACPETPGQQCITLKIGYLYLCIKNIISALWKAQHYLGTLKGKHHCNT